MHGEQGHEGRDGDQRREEYGLIDLQRAGKNEPQPVGPCAGDRRIRQDASGRDQSGRQRVAAAGLVGRRSELKIPENVLDQDHRGIDNDAEIDGADREQVGVLFRHHHDDDGEKQRKWNIGADNDGAAQVAEENPLDDENQRASEKQVVQYSLGGDVDERHAVVKGNDLHSRRQFAIGVEFLDFGRDARVRRRWCERCGP